MPVHHIKDYKEKILKEIEEAKKEWLRSDSWNEEEYRVDYLQKLYKKLEEMEQEGTLFYTDF